jgi:hypothetical protein
VKGGRHLRSKLWRLGWLDVAADAKGKRLEKTGGVGGGRRPEMEGVERRCTIAMARSQACWREKKK